TIFLLYFFFFFSSRIRHTIFSRDWSSDVCSSDLSQRHQMRPGIGRIQLGRRKAEPAVISRVAQDHDGMAVECGKRGTDQRLADEIGRASCRERVYIKMILD